MADGLGPHCPLHMSIPVPEIASNRFTFSETVLEPSVYPMVTGALQEIVPVTVMPPLVGSA
jgi:hypothetical protein